MVPLPRWLLHATSSGAHDCRAAVTGTGCANAKACPLGAPCLGQRSYPLVQGSDGKALPWHASPLTLPSSLSWVTGGKGPASK